MTQSILVVEVDSSGATITIDPTDPFAPQIVWLKPQGGSPITLSGNWSIAFSTDPAQGNQTTFIWFAGDFGLDNNTYTFQIQSQSITQDMLNVNGAFTAITVDEAGLQLHDAIGGVDDAGGNAVRPEAVDQPAIALLPQEAAEPLGRAHEDQVVQFVEVPLVQQEQVERPE